MQASVSDCEKCRSCIVNKPAEDLALVGGDQTDPEITPQNESNVMDRVRELEMELAQTKLAHVEAECRNQVS